MPIFDLQKKWNGFFIYLPWEKGNEEESGSAGESSRIRESCDDKSLTNQAHSALLAYLFSADGQP
jgi:hypothetical protein